MRSKLSYSGYFSNGIGRRSFVLSSVLICLSFLGMTIGISAATLPNDFIETSVGGLSSPTSISLHPDGRVFVCEQGGTLRIIKNGVLLATPFVTVTTTSSGERGLLGVAFDPNYATNKYVYVYYTATTPATHNRISRFTADVANNEDTAVAGSEFILMDLDNLSGATNHNGGAIHFGPDGKLYVAVGENATQSNAQDLSNRLGKMLRLNSDGSIPSDNPTTFPGISGRMFVNDVGNATWEEVDNEIAGLNYGWPTCEGPFLQSTSTPCANANYTDPIYAYSSGSGSDCAITGGDFYNPTTNTFPAMYVGKYFLSDYCGGWIKYIDPANPATLGNAATFATNINAPIDIDVASDGSLYYLARDAGSVFRVQYNGPTPTSTATSTPTSTPTASSTSTPTGTPTATPTGATISGTVFYVNASSTPRYVSNVQINGVGSPNVSTTTAAPGTGEGTYTLTGFGSGSYTVTPSKTGGVNNSISSFDAARVAQHVTGIPPLLNANQRIAADTSGNGEVSSFDAAQIAQYVVSAGGGHAGEWKFLPASRNYASVTGSITGENYDAVLVGEVTGNWNNTGARAMINRGPQRATTVELPRLVSPSGEDIAVPVAVRGIANKGIIAYEFDLRYDPSVIQPQKTAIDVAGTVSRGLSVVVNADEPGLVRVAVYGPMPITNSGVLLNLNFTAIGKPGSVSPLTWDRLILNEGTPSVTTTNGQVELF
jgi:glucose/arabinose dehydrogenase